MSATPDVASIRLDNALRLFDEFVRNTIKHADAATLRGLERRFAERLQIQPSYWSQIKSRSRQIGERLARQFEQCCHKPAGWMDQLHGPGLAGGGVAAKTGAGPSGDPATPGSPGAHGTLSYPAAAPPPATPSSDSPLPRDDDERFIVGLVLTYYRRHPQRARTRLLDLLGEVLLPAPEIAPAPLPVAAPVARPPRDASGAPIAPKPAPAPPDPHALWLQTQSGVAPLKKKR